MTWNVEGPAGPTGPAGPAGPTGPTGPAGTVDTSNFYTRAESDLRFARGDADVVSAGGNLSNGTSETATIPNIGTVTFSCGAGAVTTVSLDVPNTGSRFRYVVTRADAGAPTYAVGGTFGGNLHVDAYSADGPHEAVFHVHSEVASGSSRPSWDAVIEVASGNHNVFGCDVSLTATVGGHVSFT